MENNIVAPLAGAWIEIPSISVIKSTNSAVAPLAGAWIEMQMRMIKEKLERRRSPRGSVD